MIKLEYSYEQEGPESAIYAHGHLDKTQFFKEADKKLQEDFAEMPMDELCLTESDVHHEWWRDEPTEDEEFIQFISCACDEPGAYGVTVIRIN